ncbi:MAG TPA: hypothetical protein VI583_04405, partial [Cyclobacteriaceae bacterium]|nr:hypothetical protein [Cyclobacteriaceae bacterium]
AKVLKNALDLFNSNITPKEAINLPAEKTKEKKEGESEMNKAEKKDVLEVSKTGQPEKSFFDEIE